MDSALSDFQNFEVLKPLSHLEKMDPSVINDDDHHDDDKDL